MTEPLPLDPSTAKIRFTRYLYVGAEYPVYHSSTPPTNTLDKLPSLDELASTPSTELYPLEKISAIFTHPSSHQKPETLIFALAASAKQQKSEKLRHSAYDFASKHLKNPNHFILFISITSRLSKQQSIPKHGYGHGWRSAVNNWYLSKTPQNLSEIVTKYKSRHGWTHKDILKLSHPMTKSLPPDHRVVFKYITSGLQMTKTEFLEESKAREILEFLERVEDFRKCQDPIRVAAMIRDHHYDLEHVHAGLMKSPDVWEALIEGMDVLNLVKNLQRINDSGLITAGSQILEKIVTKFLDKDGILKSRICPAEIFLAVRRYENFNGVPMPMKRRIGRKNKLRHRGIPRADESVIEAIYWALDASFCNVDATGLKYLVTVSAGWKMGNEGLGLEGNASWVVEAACIVALGLLRADEMVTMLTFTGAEGLNAKPIHIDKNASFQESVERIKARSTGPPNLGKPILWAAHHRRKYDVFINVVDKMREKYDFTGRAIDLYKKKMNLPNTRLVNWVVGSTSTYMEGRNVHDVLTVCGFDVHVPRIIEAFAKHEF